MSGLLNELGRAAGALTVGQVPTEVLDAMRGLHLARAGLHVGYADGVIGGQIGPVAPALWDAAEGDLEQLCGATAVGLEVGARVGLYRLFASPDAASEALPARVATAVALAWLRGQAADLSAFADDLDRDNPLPLPGAGTELGRVWLGRSLALATGAGSPWTNVAVEAVHEILHRHVRASDKRLRPDQIERVEIRVNGWTGRADAALPAEARIAAQVGRLVATNERDGQGEVEGAAAVAERTDVTTDLRLTVKGANALAGSLGGLVGGGMRALRASMPLIGGVHMDAVAELVRARPDRALRIAMRAPGTLAGAEPQAWALPVEVKLYTSRGGWWPERRMRPEGTIVGNDLRMNAVTRWVRGDNARKAAADALLDAPGSRKAADWVRELRA